MSMYVFYRSSGLQLEETALPTLTLLQYQETQDPTAHLEVCGLVFELRYRMIPITEIVCLALPLARNW